MWRAIPRTANGWLTTVCALAPEAKGENHHYDAFLSIFTLISVRQYVINASPMSKIEQILENKDLS
jgi:hypothetical protein